MTQTPENTPNTGQQAAAQGFFEFLFSDEREMIIKGGGGVGKTWLMSHMIDEIIPAYHDTCKLMGLEPKFSTVEMTATTNKAAEVLAQGTKRPTNTIYSLMNLKVEDDYQTGKSRITKTANWFIHENKIIFVDESSMEDNPLLNHINEGTLNCKIVHVGDHCQLAPVMESHPPVFNKGYRAYTLTEPVRNATSPELMAICQQLRETVETGIFKPIKIVPGVIDYLTDQQAQIEIDKLFNKQTTDSRILAYTNKRVIEYNDYVRTLRNLPDQFTVGEFLVNNSSIQLRGRRLAVEEEVEIISLKDPITVDIDDSIKLEVREAEIATGIGDRHKVLIPTDREYYTKLIKWYGKQRKFRQMFDLKNKYADLRPRDACTVHKSQGSTHDTVIIDLGDISRCHNPNDVARMLYVAFTRPRFRIFLYGQLADKYGGLTF